jgi:hypothetical protein
MKSLLWLESRLDEELLLDEAGQAISVATVEMSRRRGSRGSRTTPGDTVCSVSPV